MDQIKGWQLTKIQIFRGRMLYSTGGVMKVILLCLVIFLVQCGVTTVRTDTPAYTPTRKMDASVIIHQWIPHEGNDEWGVTIFFELINTGNVQIAYYELYFDVVCEDGSTYEGEGWGPYAYIGNDDKVEVADPVLPGNKDRGQGGVGKCSSKPVSVTLRDKKLYQYR
jgi:hypothetical protein